MELPEFVLKLVDKARAPKEEAAAEPEAEPAPTFTEEQVGAIVEQALAKFQEAAAVPTQQAAAAPVTLPPTTAAETTSNAPAELTEAQLLGFSDAEFDKAWDSGAIAGLFSAAEGKVAVPDRFN